MTEGAAEADSATGTETDGRKIGVLGGSFNPAHSGHFHISRLALDLLGLDEVWWLVSPQNPLKLPGELAPLDERLKGARDTAAAEPRIRVSDFEREAGTRYTVDTLDALLDRHRGTRFVWIMGADNLAEFHRWKDWTGVFERVPVAVFDRPTYSFRALEGQAARRFAGQRVGRSEASTLALMTPPAWTFLWTAFDPASATAIREGGPETGTGATSHRR